MKVAIIMVPCEPYVEVAYDLSADKQGTRHVVGTDIHIDFNNVEMPMPLGTERCTQYHLGDQWFRIIFEKVGEVTFG